MSTTPQPTAQPAFQLATPLNGLAWNAEGTTVAAAGGNGVLYLAKPGMAEPFKVEINADTALLSLVNTPHGFVTGNDGGQLHLTTAQGESTLLATFPGQFIEHLAYHADMDALMFACGKKLGCFKLGEADAKPFFLTENYPLPSSIGGLACSPIGRRVAASHYNGVSIFDISNPKNPPRLLSWKGSHLHLTYSPDGKWLISAMQEQAIHLWRMSDGLDLQMRGYPGKITQFAWSADEMWLATNGGSGVPLWNFKDKLKGPAGQQAKVVADSGAPELLVTSVALHPKGPFMAVGYADGLALLTSYEQERAVLLHHPQPEDTGGSISHVAWSSSGLYLAAVTTSGMFALTDFSQLA